MALPEPYVYMLGIEHFQRPGGRQVPERNRRPCRAKMEGQGADALLDVHPVSVSAASPTNASVHTRPGAPALAQLELPVDAKDRVDRSDPCRVSGRVMRRPVPAPGIVYRGDHGRLLRRVGRLCGGLGHHHLAVGDQLGT